MMTNRINEIMDSMKAFTKESYKRNEVLPELFALQQEIVDLTFNEDHSTMAELKIWDVENHLEQLNQKNGHVADEELARFKDGSKTLCNLIKAEISGQRGETKAFRALQYVRSKNVTLKNVELSDGERRTELDAVVITPSIITIVEVKNTRKNIFIDENGNYYRTGEFLRWDCNIAEKMALKEELLRNAISGENAENIPIRSIVVFTDNRIEVQNKYPGISTCFVSQLAHIIDESKNEVRFAIEDMLSIESLIKNAEIKEAYPFRFDVAQYKRDFATLMATLEFASEQSEQSNHEKVGIDSRRKRVVLRRLLATEHLGYIGSVAIAVMAAAISASMTAGSLRKEVAVG